MRGRANRSSPKPLTPVPFPQAAGGNIQPAEDGGFFFAKDTIQMSRLALLFWVASFFAALSLAIDAQAETGAAGVGQP